MLRKKYRKLDKTKSQDPARFSEERACNAVETEAVLSMDDFGDYFGEIIASLNNNVTRFHHPKSGLSEPVLRKINLGNYWLSQ